MPYTFRGQNRLKLAEMGSLPESMVEMICRSKGDSLGAVTKPPFQSLIWAAIGLLALYGCGEPSTNGTGRSNANGPSVAPPPPPPTAAQVDSRPAPMHQPIPLYENGRISRQIDAATARDEGFVVLDLGEEWTPYLFTERGNEAEEALPNYYRNIYLALARGEFPDDHHGARARDDKYLELYGIMPTLNLLRTRFRQTRANSCIAALDLAPLVAFDGFIAYESREAARRFADRFRVLERWAMATAEARQVDVSALTAEGLSTRDQAMLAEWNRVAARGRAIRAAQQRLDCEGYLQGKGPFVEAGFDWATHEALAEFEKRHRIYGWGFLGRETLQMLRRPPIEGEQEAVVRILTERAMHASGVIEDGSVPGNPTYVGPDGAEHPIPNLEGQIRSLIIEAFGLHTPDSTFAFLETLGPLDASAPRLVAFRGPELPPYYTADMDLSATIDRGDVWYEFPYDEQGRERAQPVERRPRLTISTRYGDQVIPLARFGTTVGGWRSEVVNGWTFWKYKNSPTGPVVWHQVVAAPVWMPPEGTPPRELLHRGRNGRWVPNYHESGPSYASAYGLVAAYHIRYVERDDGTFRLGGDEGIRTHGSVNYMSIMRMHSHGCHRLHNHMAVRLMSFVLAHRQHVRVGQQRVAYTRNLLMEGETIPFEITQGGYVFQLQRPIRVDVREGRILGSRRVPITEPMPKFDANIGAYVMPDGQTVAVSRTGEITPVVPPPRLDGSIHDAGPRG